MIKIDRSVSVPLYQQIYDQMKSYIVSQTMANGEKLTSIRKGAEFVGVSKNTVELAYQMLVADGYVVNVRGSGYYVSYVPENEPDYGLPKRVKEPMKIIYDMSNKKILQEVFSKRFWRNNVIKALTDLQGATIMERPSHGGDMELRQNIANFLFRFRGVRCTAEQVIITTGMGDSAYIIGTMFSPEIFSAVFENPSADEYRRVLSRFRYNLSYIEPIGDNFNAQTVSKYKNVLLYLTPIHNLLSGTRLSKGARAELLEWVKTSNSYILEDDRDSEFFLKASPPSAIQGDDENERVIHIGDLNFILSPAMNVGYLVLPKHLVSLYNNFFEKDLCSVPLLVQYSLREYLKSGHLQRYIEYLRKRCAKSSQMLMNSLTNTFSDKITVISNKIGYNIVIAVHNGMSERELVYSAAVREVKVMPVSPFYCDGLQPKEGQVMLCFAGLTDSEIPKAVVRLGEAWFGDNR